IPIDFSRLDKNRYYSIILDSVEEGNHIFNLFHTGNGDMSVSTEAEATSYGDRYQATLAPRSIRSVTVQEGKVTIVWRAVVENCVVVITYSNVEGITTKRSVNSSEIVTVI